MKYMVQRSCPHCGSGCTWRHGSFPRKDGTRQPRWLCGACGRTFSPNTGTPLYYIKKYHKWPQLGMAMARRLSIRSTARVLGVGSSTAFHWRHLTLKELAGDPQPVLTEAVATCEAFVPYSEKGSRTTHGPGSWGYRLAPASSYIPRAQRFRRFVDGKPSCVLLACNRERRAVAIIGSGRPQLAEVEATLKRLLGAGAQLCGQGSAPYAAACRRLGVPCASESMQESMAQWTALCWEARILQGQLYSFLRPFHGVATRYLNHYLAWFSATRRTVGMPAAA